MDLSFLKIQMLQKQLWSSGLEKFKILATLWCSFAAVSRGTFVCRSNETFIWTFAASSMIIRNSMLFWSKQCPCNNNRVVKTESVVCCLNKMFSKKSPHCVIVLDWENEQLPQLKLTPISLHYLCISINIKSFLSKENVGMCDVVWCCGVRVEHIKWLVGWI